MKYKQMEKEKVGLHSSSLYLAWSAALKAANNLKEAIKILQKVCGTVSLLHAMTCLYDDLCGLCHAVLC